MKGDKDFIIITTKQFDLYNKLKVLVSKLRKEENLKIFCGVCREYYDILFHNFDDIVFFVKTFNRSFLENILLDDDLDNFIEKEFLND